MIPAMTRRLPRLALWAAGCAAGLLAPPVGADPMRPLNPPAAASAAAPAVRPATARDNAPLPRLVAIREDSEGRRQALFGEQWLGVGERIGDRTAGPVVQAITAQEVAVANGKSRQLLHLLPPLQAAAAESTAELGTTSIARADPRKRQRRQGSTTP